MERGQRFIGVTAIGTNTQKALWQKNKKINKRNKRNFKKAPLPLAILQNKIFFFTIDFPTDILLIYCIQQLCDIKLKVGAGFSETHTAFLHLPTGSCINAWYQDPF